MAEIVITEADFLTAVAAPAGAVLKDVVIIGVSPNKVVTVNTVEQNTVPGA